MPRKAKELTAVAVRNITEAGMHAVGGVAGLYLQVTATGGKTWILRVKVGNRRREIGLGGFPDVPLARAREKARETREKIEAGIDPVAERQAARAALIESQDQAKTFEAVAADVIAKKQQESSNPKHAQQWANTLKTYAFPKLGKMPVDAIEMGHVVEALKPIWTTKTETATRVRQRIEAVFSLAIARGYRKTANPATWSLLKNELPNASKVKTTQNFPALPWRQVGAFVSALQDQEGVAARALEFLTLTAARSGEVRGATWAEIDMGEKVWTIPGKRMKSGKTHRVPLCDRALDILESVKGVGAEIVFPAPRGGVMSDATMKAVIKRMNAKATKAGGEPWIDPTQTDEKTGGPKSVTPHGFRSSFKDWARNNAKGYDDEVSELALAHVNSDATRSAYARDELIEQRRDLMNEWAAFCAAMDVVE